MIDIYDLYIDFKARANINQGGYVSPVVFQSWVNNISSELFRDKVARWQESQQLTDDMGHLSRSKNVTVTPVPGKAYDVAILPSDYEYFIAAGRVYNRETGKGCIVEGKGCIKGQTGEECSSADCRADNKYIDPDLVALEKLEQEDNLTEVAISIIDNQRWRPLLEHYTKKPTVDKPAITVIEGSLKVAPKHTGVIILDYFVAPVKTVFAYTVGSNDEILYDQGNSVPLDWPDRLKPEFISRLLKNYGVAVQNENFYAAGERERVING